MLSIPRDAVMIGGIVVEMQRPPYTLREFLGWPTLIVGGIMALGWLALLTLSWLAMFGAGVDEYTWESATFVFWEFSFVLLTFAVFGTGMTLATYGVTVFVRHVKQGRTAPGATA